MNTSTLIVIILYSLYIYIYMYVKTKIINKKKLNWYSRHSGDDDIKMHI